MFDAQDARIGSGAFITHLLGEKVSMGSKTTKQNSVDKVVQLIENCPIRDNFG